MENMAAPKFIRRSGAGFPSAAFLLLGAICPALAVTPNSVTIRTYSSNGVLENVTRSYSDGLGRGVQSQLENGATDIITGTVYDKFGRPVKKVKPVPTTAAGHSFYAGDILNLANAWYDGTAGKGPASGGAAYSETVYSEDPLGRVVKAGAPGAVFSVTGGHALRKWYLGRAGISFIPAPTDAILDATLPEANAKYFLEVSKDANGDYAQAIKDINGNLLRTWVNAGATSSGIIEAVNYPDYTGHVLKSLAAGETNSTDAAYSYFEFTAGGQILSSDTPDEGMVQMVYNKSGELRFTRSERDMQPPYNGNRFRVMKYDPLGRMIEVGVFFQSDAYAYYNEGWAENRDFPWETTEFDYHPKIRHYYDRISALPGELAVPAFILSALTNTRGRLIASVAFDESGDLTSGFHRVVEFFSYDKDGRMDKKYKIIPGLPVQRFGFTYDLQGKAKSKLYNSLNGSGSATFADSWTYQYDARGRLSAILANNVAVAGYEYDILGQLIGKHLKKDAVAVADEAYTYNIRDWLLTHRSTNAGGGIYHETLTYDAVSGTPRYDGNISSATHAYPNKGLTASLFYKYDNVGQLVATTGTAGYGESFSYDAKGRIKQKNEGAKSYGPYNYVAGTHQVASVLNSPMANPLGNYVYDPNGNMILDRSKKMTVEYDWRNMPVAFKFFKSLPNREIAWSEVANLKFTDGLVQSTEVQVMYDASGNRVWKKTLQF